MSTAHHNMPRSWGPRSIRQGERPLRSTWPLQEAGAVWPELTLTALDPCLGTANPCLWSSHRGETIKNPKLAEAPGGPSGVRHPRTGSTVSPGLACTCPGALPRWCPRHAGELRSGSFPWSRSCIPENLPRCLPGDKRNGNAISRNGRRSHIF